MAEQKTAGGHRARAASQVPETTVGDTAQRQTPEQADAERRSVAPVGVGTGGTGRFLTDSGDEVNLEDAAEGIGDEIVRLKHDVYEEIDLPGTDRKGLRLAYPAGREVRKSALTKHAATAKPASASADD